MTRPVCLVTALLALAGARGVDAQVLRVGGFDFNAKARTELVYSSNVNRERPGESAEEPEDYYYVVGLDLKSTRQMGRATVIDISTGIAEEQHFVREDLNNSENPFGRFSLNSATDVGRLRLGGDIKWEKTAESQVDQYSPGGRNRARDPRDIFTYGLTAANLAQRKIEWNYRYEFNSEMHEDERFVQDNREEVGNRFTWNYAMTRRLKPGYAYTGLDSTYENNPSNDRQRVKHELMLPFTILDKPALTYTFIWQRDDRDDGSPVQWKPRNILQLTDERTLSPTIGFAYYARYDDEQRPEQDDVRFQYGASLSHQISRTASHSVSVDRQPVSTLGSTLESDITQYQYFFTKSDLFINDLDWSFYVGYQISVPESDRANGEEKTTRYGTTLDYRRNVTSRLVRRIQYLYTFEESNMATGPLEEHRATLGYEYFF